VDCAEPEKTREPAVVELTDCEGVTVGVNFALREAREGVPVSVKAEGEGERVPPKEAEAERDGAEAEGEAELGFDTIGVELGTDVVKGLNVLKTV